MFSEKQHWAPTYTDKQLHPPPSKLKTRVRGTDSQDCSLKLGHPLRNIKIMSRGSIMFQERKKETRMAGWTEGCKLIFALRQCRWPIKSAVNKASASDSLKLLLRLSADKLYSPEDKLSLTRVCVCDWGNKCLCVCVCACVYMRVWINAAILFPCQLQLVCLHYKWKWENIPSSMPPRHYSMRYATFWHHMHN